MARATRAEFSGARVRLARAFNGWTQAELGERIGVTHQYIGYLETGHKFPAPLMLEAIADATGFATTFFYQALVDEFRDEECHFRRRSTTPVSVRTRVLAHGTLFGALVSYIEEILALPAENVPSFRPRSIEDIESAADRCRIQWGLGRDVPIKTLTRVIERAGVVVTRFEGSSTKVDAFSRAGKRSVVVLNTEKGAPSRTRFDLAHEAGHLVMHGGLTTGDVETERQADRFASALLLPRAGYIREFPRGQRMDWAALFRLKKRWGTSVAAQVRRAYDLRLIDAAQYQRAYKYMAAQGWLKGEPDELEVEEPELIQLSLAEIEKHFRTPPVEVCRRLRWRKHTFEKVAVVSLPEETPEERDQIIQLDLVRAERNRPS